MSERDYNKQVVKRERISRETLVIGVDVGNAFNAVGFMNKEGKVLGNCAKLYNSRDGFEQRAGREKLDSDISGKAALN
jgi:hypothetical protein